MGEISGYRVVGRTKHGTLRVDDLAELAPGMADLMDTFARRYWTLYYAAKGGNWELARYEWREGRSLLEASTKTRPKYADDVREFLAGPYARLGAVLDAADDREVVFPLRRSLEEFLGVLQDDVHVGVEPIENAAVSPAALQLDDHARADRLVQEGQGFDHPRGRRILVTT